ncbi:undecaprenyl-phosphate glucose phosphotransferase [Chromobacterium violaceum]|uniref:Uncharacterized protein n=1 Tax=Chromobacterium violaceum (strain ATCC 12472 / DSM 30191 / JCM 1249 / CCUG 213 / NBRC 12614 / NCIMB 9131 / NCTC 9757 / MK) TaxID=243365 RepID=Q7NT81_CHRVO|nr:conserved hypothetical protein [Chromobacterium violaceum ATCC 12472]SUX39311.1 undecaprenyl-phosphate glucose phosphotransferase [Chromobacterium violaceum]
MRVRTVDNLVVTHPEVLSYIALMLRLLHLAMVTLPGYALCWLRLPQLRAQAVYLLEACFYAGLLAMVVFQAADIYGQDLFSRFLRIRPLALAWSVAFLLLLVRPLVPLILQRLAMHWSGARLVSRGVGLQRAVVLGATASGKLLAEFLCENADLRSRLIGYVEDRHDRPHETMATLSCLGDLRELERMVRDGDLHQAGLSRTRAVPAEALRLQQQVDRSVQVPLHVRGQDRSRPRSDFNRSSLLRRQAWQTQN